MAMATGFPLSPMEEPVTALASPAGTASPVQYGQYNPAGATSTISLVTTTPLLCANTSAPMAQSAVAINSIYYSANGSSGAHPLPFVFGATSSPYDSTVSAAAIGANEFNYTSGGFEFTGDATGTLVCYGLDANGARRVTRDMFEDNFDGAAYNSTVTLSVFHTPTSSTDYYGYTIDVTIPALPANTDCSANGLDCNFALLEGYDTSVFATNAGAWCLAPAGAQNCPLPAPPGGTPASSGNLNINYSSYAATVSLKAPVLPAADAHYHFVAIRFLRSGVSSLPASGAPVAMAALFSPSDLEENKLDDNVSVGNNTVANAAPSIAQDTAYTAFTNSLANLTEGASAPLSFDISDVDTPGALTAAVTMNLPGNVALTFVPNCTGTSPPSGGAAATCTFNIPLSTANWWDSAPSVVAAGLQGQFNAVATELTGGNFLPATVQVVVTDSANKSSAPVSLPVHIHSSANNAPVVNTALSLAADSFQSNAMIPTYSCSISAVPATPCGARGYVTLAGVFSAVPGPAAAFDELATQTTAVKAYTGGDANGGNVQCVAESGSIFVTNLSPFVQASGNGYDVDFLTSSTVGSALCTLTITDQMTTFPNSETAKTATSQFRIVVKA